MNNRRVLLEENDFLREGYIKLLNEKEIMQGWGKAQLEALYATRIGILNLEKLKLKLSVKALKRKIERVHRAVVKNEQPDFTGIEFLVAGELAEVEEKIMKQTEAISKARMLSTHLNSPKRNAELRMIFRRIAKKLHPDVNPVMTDEQLELWYKLKDAYDLVDLERVKALQRTYRKQIDGCRTSEEMAPEELEWQNATLKEGIRLLEKEIEVLNRQFPFTLRDKINDTGWLAEQQESIRSDLTALIKYEEELRAEYRGLMEIYG